MAEGGEHGFGDGFPGPIQHVKNGVAVALSFPESPPKAGITCHDPQHLVHMIYGSVHAHAGQIDYLGAVGARGDDQGMAPVVADVDHHQGSAAHYV